jgi:hypothetical protein
MIAVLHAVFAACVIAVMAPTVREAQPPTGASLTDTLAFRLNLPAYRLDVRIDDAVVSYHVAIGTRRYPTPRGAFTLRRVELNPAWIPPASDWARDRVPLPPGPHNPMGRAKFEFSPTYYLHGTPEPASVGSAASHGCVRLRNEDALALGMHLVLWGRPDIPLSTLARWLSDSTTGRTVVLARPATLEIRYDLVEVRSDRVHVHSDPYRLRSDSTDVLAQAALTAGLAPRPVPAGTAASLLDLARAGAFTISADSVSAALFPPLATPTH